MKRPFYFEAKSEQEADLHIYGPIGANNASYGDGTNNTAYALVSLIKRLDKVYSKINIHINSPGGSIDEGLAIYNTLIKAKAEIHTFNSGLTASMASIIMLAGTTHMPKTSIFHLHRASTIAIGNVNDFEQTIEALNTFESTLKQAIADKTGMTVGDIEAKWFNGKEHYMTAEQASEFGFVDYLEDTKVKTPASLENLQNMNFNQVVELYANSIESDTEQSFLNKIKNFFNPSTSNKNQSDMAKLIFKAKLTLLLALIGLEQFMLNDEGKVEMELDQAYKVNDELEARAVEIDNLKQENVNLREQNAALNLRIDEMQAKIDKTPLEPASNPKSKDNVIVDEKPVDNLSVETAKALHEYNRKTGLYK